jgi:hypothetical protein
MKSLHRFIYSILALQLLFSCSSDTKTSGKSGENSDTTMISIDATPVFEHVDPDTLVGMYSGNFGKSFIHLHLTYLNDHKAVGYDIHKGLQRNLTGNITEREKDWLLVLEEPGDNPYDGIFTLEISKNDQSVKGSWKARDPKIGTKSFTLEKVNKKEKEEEKAKKAPTSDEITPVNFLEYFDYVTSIKGDCEFRENGLIVLHNMPRDENGNHREQEVVVKGAWRFIKNNKIELDWQPNQILKKTHHVVSITYDPEYHFPSLVIEDFSFNPIY